MNRLRIETLTRTQADWVAGAAVLLHTVFRPQGSWVTVEEALAEVDEMLAPERFVRVGLARNGDGSDEVVGWIGGIPAYDGNVWELHPLVVSPARQRQGIGTLLIRDFEAQVRARGGLTIQLGTDDVMGQTSLSGTDLYTDLWEQIRTIRNLDNHPFEFYQKMGYTIIGVMPDANGRGKPDIYMAKRV